jgi:hypothetical protein
MTVTQRLAPGLQEVGVTGTDDLTLADSSSANAGEPVFDSSIHTSVYYEDFESYADIAALKAAYPARRETRGTLNLDTSIAAEGSQSLRIDWQDPEGCPGDADVLIEKGASIGSQYRTCFTSLYFRIAADASLPGGTLYDWGNTPCGGNASKFLIAWRQGGVGDGRCDMGATSEPAAPNIYGTLAGLRWKIAVAAENGDPLIRLRQHLNDGTSGVDLRPASLANGVWHRYTVKFVKQSAIGTGDGIAQMWIDGSLVLDYDGSDPADPAFGLVYAKTSTFAGLIQYHAVFNRSAPQLQSLWYDAVRIWRMTAVEV